MMLRLQFGTNSLIKIIKLIPAVFYNVMIWTLSSKTLPFTLGCFDKTAHTMEYAGLGFLLAFGLNLSKENFDLATKRCLLFGALTGISDEFHQFFVPGRSCDIIDFGADIVGISLGILTFLLFLKLLRFFKRFYNTKRDT